jgi:perosamine synthetase
MTAGRVLIPLTRPHITDDEVHAAADAVRTGWLVQGPQVAAFEEAIAYYVGARHAVATTSGTTALHLALQAMNVGPDDEVIVPSFAFIATANAVVHTGARPVFVDIDPRTCALDPNAVEDAITPRTRAIIPVDHAGLPAPLDAMLFLAAQCGAWVLEDASSALGASSRGRRVGSVSPATSFSFHAHEAITTGEGGMITTNDGSLAARMRRLRAHGASLGDPIRLHVASLSADEYDVPGYNYRMTDIQAAVGLAQIKKIDWILERRRSLAERYTRLLTDLPGLTLPIAPPDSAPASCYAVRLDPAVWPERDAVIEQLLAQGISSRRGTMAIHLEPYYRRRFGRLQLPATEAAARQSVLLPLFTTMTMGEQDRVVEALRGIALRKVAQQSARSAPAPAARPQLSLLHGSRPPRAAPRRGEVLG